MQTINYDRHGKRIATQKNKGAGFTMGRAQLLILALFATGICYILGHM